MESSNPAAHYQKSSEYPAEDIPVPSGNRESGGPAPWSTGLFGCSDDVDSCCITFWCPCITFGRIAEIVDKGATTCATAGAIYALIYLVFGCGFLYSCLYRSKIRNEFMLKEGPCPDLLVHCCCEMCALCQE